jgi:hypothetical protein
MADGVHAGVHPVQPAGRDARANGASTKPQSHQLPQRHNAMLRHRQLRDRSLQAGVWRKTAS